MDQEQFKALAKRSQKESLENKFLATWVQEFPDLPPPVRQFKFHPHRKWRFDFAFPDADVLLAVEISGGTWRKGGHTSPLGITKDYEKLRAAQRLGWRVLPYSSKDCEDMVAVVTEVAEFLCQVPEETQ